MEEKTPFIIANKEKIVKVNLIRNVQNLYEKTIFKKKRSRFEQIK